MSELQQEQGGFFGQEDAAHRILHPQRDRIEDHLQELPDGQLAGLTPIGIFHIRRLRLNRPQLIILRQARHQAAQSAARISQLEATIDSSRKEISTLEGEVEGLLALIDELVS